MRQRDPPGSYRRPDEGKTGMRGYIERQQKERRNTENHVASLQIDNWKGKAECTIRKPRVWFPWCSPLGLDIMIVSLIPYLQNMFPDPKMSDCGVSEIQGNTLNKHFLRDYYF